MKITHIETIRVDERPQIIWVNIHADNGIIGLGETWYAPTVVESAIHDHFGPLLIGRDPRKVELHWHSMFNLSDHAGYGGAEMRAISAIDMALWDIKGQDAGLPIYELLGGAVRERIKVYATGLPYSGFVEYVKKLLDKGITAMKIGPTIPLALASDGQFLSLKDLDIAIRPIKEIRDAVGYEIQIANDGHGKWTLPVAIRIAQAMEPYEIMWQEDLMPVQNANALRELQSSTKTPICISERLLSRWQFREFIENGSARIVMPDLIWTGGISETKKIAILASSYQVPFAPHDCTGPVNIFGCAQICMSSINAMIQEFVPTYYEGWYGDFVDPNLDIVDGFLNAPQIPGIGTKLKEEVKQRKDVHIKVSSTPNESPIDDWETLDTWGKKSDFRSRTMEEELRILRKERSPYLFE